MAIGFLGPLQVEGAPSLRPRSRVVLAVLAMRRGERVTPDQLADALWGDDLPQSWPKQVQICVWSLRKELGAAVIETIDGGYRLGGPIGEVDVEQFEQLLERGRALVEAGESDRATAAIERALTLWRGQPFVDLDRWMPGRVETARLEELRMTAQEDVVATRLSAGEHQNVVASAESLALEQPLRERRWELVALAQYRCGRQGDALRSLRRAREILVRELGVAPGPALIDLERAILTHDPSLLTADAHIVSSVCPYRGLASFDADDADMFFGRDLDVVTCLRRLEEVRLLVLTGSSGCGKSSLARAGIVPALRARHFEVVMMTPGVDPASSMTAALAGTGGCPLLVVDQMEELFVGVEHADQVAFCQRLARYSTERAPVIATIRSDRVGRLAADPTLARLVEQGLFFVTPLSGDDLRAVIERPAAAAGLRLESGLTDLLMRETEGEPGALPLLSHALAETWARRDGRVLTVEAYRDTGGIRSAIARSAEQLYEALPEDQRSIVRSLLLRLVAVSDDGDPVKVHAPREALPDQDRERMIDLLVRARLVTADDTNVELAHEAVARAWPRLRNWLEEDAEGHRTLRHLSAAATGWQTLGRPDSELYRGARLQAALEWRATAPELTATERDFLDAAVEREDAERDAVAARARTQARQNLRLRTAVAMVGALLVIALIAGAVSFVQRDRARAEARDAALTALVSDAVALRSSRRDLAALLAIEAHRLHPDAASESALFGTFTGSPGADRTIATDIAMTLQNPHADAAYLDDNESLAVADVNGAVNIVEIATGGVTRLAPLSADDGESTLAISADRGSLAVTWHETEDADRSTVVVWDVSSRTQRFEPVSIPFAASAVAVAPGGAIVAVVDNASGRAILLDGANGTITHQIPPLQAEQEDRVPSGLAFSSTGEKIAVGSPSGPIRLVDPTDGSETGRIGAVRGRSNTYLQFIGDDQTLAAGGFGGIEMYDVATGASRWATAPDVACRSVVAIESIGHVVCGQWSGRVLTFDLSTGTRIGRRFESQHGDVCGLAVTPQGDRLATVSSCVAGTATVGQWRLDGSGPVSHLVTRASGDRYVEQFGFQDTNALIAGWVDDGAPSPITRAVDADGTVLAELPGLFGVQATDDPDIAVVIYNDGHSETIGRYDTFRHEPAGPKVDLGPLAGVFWTDGDVVTAVTNDFTALRSADLHTGQLTAPSADSTDGTFGQVVVDGDRMFLQIEDWAGDADGFRVERRDRVTTEVLARSAPGYIRVAAASGVVIAATLDGRIDELDPDSLEPIGEAFPGINGLVGVGYLQIDDTGRRLMVRADDDTLRFFDIPTRTPLGDPIDVESEIAFAAATLRADGLAAAAVTGTGIVMWDLDADNWETAACGLAGRNLTPAEWKRYIGALAPYHKTCPALD